MNSSKKGDLGGNNLFGADSYLNTENPDIQSFEVKPFGAEDPDIVVANAKCTHLLVKMWHFHFFT